MVNKLPGIKQFRALNELWIQKIPWPDINPNILTVLQVVPSVFAMLYFQDKLFVLIMLAITLFLDLADGAVAKKHDRTSKQGYYMDLFFDRISETIIFLPLLNAWLLLAVLNSLLSIYSIKKNVHLSIALRQAYGLYLLWVVLF